ncbi:hypothetical protein HOLleu_02439 [Holothuria leucospilota]|uniref:Uncharacterized protein n=1 Tax=Holothuria leucospilota TaxID=206669 RepID=A0A9Q1HH18_HOLLE|nr:hypothetical protein HOLleu_02439 [Holothuria leucospilota]
MEHNTGTHRPFRKPNDQPVYINASSNHPKSIIKHIPEAIGKRLSALSSNQGIFNSAAPIYDEALEKSGFKEEVKSKKADAKERVTGENKKRRRKRNVIWFNPPFGKNVKTSIAGTFLKLLDKHFPQGSDSTKIFNRNCVKVS